MDMATFREKAGVLVSSIVVLALVALVYVLIIVQALGYTVTVDATLLATLTGMAGIALGYLIGKQGTQPTQGQQDAMATAAVRAVERASER